jgi:outer membrane receptor protein involved in Fe transport
MNELLHEYSMASSSEPRLRTALVAVSLSALSLSVVDEARAADRQEPRANVLEEILVTAQKQSERLQDVPVPVSAIGGETLATSNQLQLQDYYSQVPGLNLGLSGNGSEVVLAIRGITSGGGLGSSGSPTVAVVVDDIAFGSSASYAGLTFSVADMDPSELARIEVLRGPQGTLYGAASLGGLLKYVTVDPSPSEFSGTVRVGSSHVSEGDDIGYSVSGAVNIPLSDALAVRMSGFTREDPGYVDNIAPGGKEDYNTYENKGGRVSAMWQPSEEFSLKLSALMQDNARQGTSDVDITLGEELQRSLLPKTGLYRRKPQAYSLTMNAKLGSADLVSATGYGIDEYSTVIDLQNVTFRNIALARFGVDRIATEVEAETRKFSQELRIKVPVAQRVEWLLGAYYTEEKSFSKNSSYAANRLTGERVGLIRANNLDPATLEERAVFTNVTVQLTDRLDVQVGGRYSENEQDFLYANGVAGIANGTGAPAVYQPFPRSSEDSAATYLFTPRWKISSDLMTYLRIASGYRPGGANIFCGSPNVACDFDADTAVSYDLGIKGSAFDQVLSFDASLYRIDWKDMQIGLLAGGLPYIDNGAESRSQGVELTLAWRPGSTRLSGWVAYSDAEVVEGFPPGLISPQRGERLPYSSKLSGNVVVKQEFPLFSSAIGFVEASASYVGDRKGNFAATTAVRQAYDAYTQVDFRGGFTYGTWSASAFVTNLTDKRGELRGGTDITALAPTVFYQYIQPRTVGLSLIKSF